MMSNIWPLLPALAMGILFGVIFFGGLWWTVRKGMKSPQPWLWFLGSFLLRLSITLVGFYTVANDDWKKFLACLVGFLLARIATTYVTRETAHAD
jgi:F1F0 ATPase subunit 2